MRRLLALALALAAGSASVCPTEEPTIFRLRYEFRVLGCGDTGCGAPGTDEDTIRVANRSDTVWLFHRVRMLASFDSTLVRLRPDCADHVWVVRDNVTVRTVPASVTCPDSTDEDHLRGGEELLRLTQWVVDRTLEPATYLVRGRMVVEPVLEPGILFEIR